MGYHYGDIEMEKVNSLLFNLCRQEDMEHMDII